MKLSSIVIIIVALASSVSVRAESSVWKISSKDGHFYLGGTIHVLSKEDHPLPAPFFDAYDAAGEIILEADLDAAEASTQFRQLALNAMVFTDTRTLDGELKDETFVSLKAFMDAREMPILPYLKFHPWAVALNIMSEELASQGMTPEYGVDYYFNALAKEGQKKVVGLESLEEQVDFMRALGNADPDAFVNYTLQDLARLNEIMDEMKAAWRDGDLDKLMVIASVVQLKNEFPEIYKVLVVQRNNNWMKKLTRLNENNTIEFVLVGALHLPGEDGLLTSLRARGYEIDQLE